MEEKERYGITDAYDLCDSAIFNTETNDILRLYQICDLLNQQDRRIKELEEENGYILFEDGYDKDGNEIHKQVYTTYKEEFTKLVLENKKLRKENQQLKQQLKEAENYIEEDEVCKREYYQKVDAEDRKKEFLIKKLQKKGKEKDTLIEQLQAENKLLKVGTKGLDDLLKSQAKEIVGDIEKNFTEYLPLKDKTGAGFYSRLNTILKKYGGEDE